MMKSKPKLPSPSSTQSGFTLIECLLAVIIVSVLLVAVSPALILSVATRVQARRVELGTEAARTYIDGVRGGTIPQPQAVAPIETVKTTSSTGTTQQLGINTFLFTSAAPASEAPPATPLTCPPPPAASPTDPTPKGFYCQNPANPDISTVSLYCINLDGKGCSSNTRTNNMVVQAFRGVTPNPTNPALTPLDLDGSKGYLLGVRVYRVDAFDGNGALKTTLTTGKKRVATFTGGVGDRKAPLVEMTTDIRGAKTSYESFRDRLGVETSGSGTTPP